MSQSRTNTNPDLLWALLLGIQLVTAPFYWRIPIPVIVTVAIFTIWVIMIALQRTGQPGRFVRVMLLVLTLAVMTVSFGTLLGREAGTGFLILLSFLKLFEVRDKRDLYVLVYLNYFLIASNFFHTQSPWVAVYVVAVVIYLTSLLILFSDRLSTIIWQDRLRMAARMILQAVPVMLILFLLFPRVPGPLWGLPKDAATAVTGLSEDMSPGSLSSLIQSDEVAFRVRFKGDAPPHDSLYWRGPVFSHYDGQTWTAGLQSARAQPNLSESADADALLTYTVTIEPHQRDWLFALEYPVKLEGTGYRLSREMQLHNKKDLASVFQYSLTSDRRATNVGLFELERTRNLHLPGQLNDKTVELAQSWMDEHAGDVRAVINQALRYFRNQPFVYTLNPPILGNDAMDDFLFETQRGFCEHYSSAFVYLMRAAGIPARVVTGYQGGDKNPLDDYIIIRQSNAHAWAEVWIEDSGWVRVDPTAAVSPDRIERGIQNTSVERELLPAILISENAWLNHARYQWDSFNNTWNEWIVGFDQHKQRQLFKRVGMERTDWQGLVTWLVLGMLITGVLVAWWVFKRGTGKRIDRIRRTYDAFCRKLAKTGTSRLINEGPQEYYDRIRHQLEPSSARAADAILRLYLKIRYGDERSRQNIKAFVRLVRSFHVRTLKA